jgi:imidazolonepropionase-like amidohydrolase
MYKTKSLRWRLVFFIFGFWPKYMQKILLSLLVLSFFGASSQTWKPVNGTKNVKNHYTAITNATIHVKSGQLLQNATLLIQNEKVVAVGTAVILPANTLVIDAKGKFIYPSFIDLHTQYGLDPVKNVGSSRGRKPQIESKKESIFYWNQAVKPETKAADEVGPKKEDADKYRKMGFGTVLTHQHDGLLRGTSALVALNDGDNFKVLQAESASQYSFNKGSSKQSYPSSLMGMIALIRQVHFDAKWYVDNSERTEYNRSLAAIEETKGLPKIFDAYGTLSQLRADKIGDEFGFQFILKGDGTEYKRMQEIKATEAALIVPIKFPKAYDVSDPFTTIRLPLSKMKDWELAPQNLSYLSNAGVEFAITSDGLKTEKEFFANLEKAIEQGLSRDAAVQSLTEIPAKLIGASKMMGTLDKGKLANFIILSDTVFQEKTKLHSNWVNGIEHSYEPLSFFEYAGDYSLNINKNEQFDLTLTGEGNSMKGKVAKKNTKEKIDAKVKLENNRINLSFTMNEKLYRLSGSVSDSQSRIWSGKTLVGGVWKDWAAIKKTNSDESKETPKTDTTKIEKEEINGSVFYPNMAFGWEDSIPSTTENLLFKNATVWTNETEGVLRNHDVFVVNGKIEMVGYKINMEVMFPKMGGSFREIDATDLHLTSGIIDEHSHIAINNGVNESGQAVTAEVSISDVVNSDDINIYRQLSGGVTTSQLLHGSANPIGGQSALIKLRWGKSPEKMKVEGADGFIKFALGENVKQSNWGDFNTVRFPQTRMGVEQVYYDAFLRAKEYQSNWTLFNAKSKRDQSKSFAPRFDIELDVLSQILDSQRFVTCHSYIQSEINMLMHVADSMEFRINTFTHVLEGYKVADKLREHGAAGSTFSDWWAYKFEVNDAIPYNGAIMHKQGVLTGFNSDDAEMGRRLNQEAAKAVKYGGVSEVEAWKFVTLNPAKMLHLDDRIGSIKKGKDADLVLWTDNPLSIYAKVVTTYIDGMPYYDASRDVELRKKVQAERERLIAKMMKEKKAGKPTQPIKKEKKMLYECDTLEE